MNTGAASTLPGSASGPGAPDVHDRSNASAQAQTHAASGDCADMRSCSHSISQRLSRKLAVLTMLVLAVLFAFAWFSVKATMVEKNREDLHYRAMVISDIIELEARSGGEAAVRARVQVDAAMRANSRLELWYADGTTCYADAAKGTRAMSEHVQSLDFMIPVAGVPGNLLRARYTADYAREEAFGQRWALISALTTLAAGALVALGTRWRTRELLRPLNELAVQTRAIAADRLDQRLRLDDPAEELLPWIEQFNALMGRLEQAYAQLEAFNADVAHELRTPLATLMMQTELALSRERPADELRDTLACSLEELQRMSALVNDMLFLSQADRGAKARRGEPVSLAALAREVAEFHEAACDERGLRVAIEGDAEMAVDEALVRRALSNLMGNACRFATPGSAVRVRIEADAASGRVTVHNDGPPVAEHDLPRLFTRFFRADVSRCCDGDEQHFGLGLAIVAAIARMHGGEPHAHSAPAAAGAAHGTTSIGFVLGPDPRTSRSARGGRNA